MSTQRQRLGKRSEALARRHLEASGYAILSANCRTSQGEIDVVAEKDGVLVFVEVRSRRPGGFGPPEESLSPRKRSHMVGAALAYLQANGAEHRDWRIDVVAVELTPGGRLARLEIIENAIEL